MRLNNKEFKSDSWSDNKMRITLAILSVSLIIGFAVFCVLDNYLKRDHELKMLQTCLEKSTFCPIIK